MRILIVDNDPSIRKALTIGMSQPGWLINAVPDDIIGVTDLVRQYQYDIVIADFGLKGMSNIEVLGELKRQNPELIVIGMTRSCTMDFFSADDPGVVNACYQKPLHLNMLKKAINLELKKLELTRKDWKFGNGIGNGEMGSDQAKCLKT